MPLIRVGCALSDVNRADVPSGLQVPEKLDEYARRFLIHLQTPAAFFELQPEDYWTTPTAFPDQFKPRKSNAWRRLADGESAWRGFRSGGSRVGVHQPIRGRDVLASSFFAKYTALEETKQAMMFAHAINADYFVFHLAMTDRWEWDRRDQMDKALKMFKAFAAYYRAASFAFVPCIEILEYPKLPATGGEAIALLAKCRAILPETRLAFGVSHLWGSRRRMIAARNWYEEGGPRVSFIDALEYALSQTWEDIHVVHLGGCWESETHAIPGLHPQQDPFHFQMKLREPGRVYAEAGEMDLNRVLDLLLEYTVRRGRDLNLVLQIYNRDIAQVLEAARVIGAELDERAARTQEPPKAIQKKPKRAPRKRKKKTRKR